MKTSLKAFLKGRTPDEKRAGREETRIESLQKIPTQNQRRRSAAKNPALQLDGKKKSRGRGPNKHGLKKVAGGIAQ